MEIVFEKGSTPRLNKPENKTKKKKKKIPFGANSFIFE